MPSTNEMIKAYFLNKAVQEGMVSAQDVQAYYYLGGKAERAKKRQSGIPGDAWNPSKLAQSAKYKQYQKMVAESAMSKSATGNVEELARDAAAAEEQRLKKMKGYRSTIHTSPGASGRLTVLTPRLTGK